MATLSIEVLAAGATEPPSEFRIFRSGFNDSTKGVWKFTPASAEKVMAKAQKYGNDLAIDYAHGMVAFFSLDPAESGKAAGWFKPEVRSGELWASAVTWTPKAKQHLMDREYRYISPAFNHDEAGEILELVNVALTNIPALHELEPLVASRLGAATDDVEDEETDMNWKQLLAMLGLAESATEADAMAALSRRDASNSELLSVTGKSTTTEAIGVVKAWKVAAESVPAMHQELSTLKQAQLDGKKADLIADGKRRGVVPPAYEPVLLSMDLPQLEAFLKVAVPPHAPAGKENTDGSQLVTSSLSAAELQVASQLGLKPEDMAKRKAARAGIVPVEMPPKAEDKAAATK